MGYYIVKTGQVVEGESDSFDFYYYGEPDNEGTPMESYWGTDFEKKKIFLNVDDANSILADFSKIPPNFIGSYIVEE